MWNENSEKWQSEYLEKSLNKKGAFFADAPIARTRQAAAEGTLAIMVGASSYVYTKIN